MVKFGYTILYVSDINKSINFYEKAFGFTRKFITAENDYGELETGQTTLSLAAKELANTNLRDGFIASSLAQKPFATELGFITDKVSEIVDLAVHHGAIIVEKPTQKPWGQTVAYLRDIDGFLIELCTPIPHG